MMMIPRRRNFFDEVFDDSMFQRKEAKMMKTDIQEKEGNYVFTIDIPGYEKESINIELENGYLTVSATTKNDINTEKEDGKYIYKERYVGECSRSFYVGDGVKEDDVKATFKNGILTITVPEETPEAPETKKHIQID